MVVGCYYSKVKYIFDFTAISEDSLGPKSYPQLPAMQSKKAKRLWVTLSTKSTKCIKIRRTELNDTKVIIKVFHIKNRTVVYYRTQKLIKTI